jgi:hypothetical protein
MDARNKHVYTCFYRFENGAMQKLTGALICSIEKAVETGRIISENSPVCFVGSGAEVYADVLAGYNDVLISDVRHNRHSAGVMGLYALSNGNNLRFFEAKDFKPVYLSVGQTNENS